MRDVGSETLAVLLSALTGWGVRETRVRIRYAPASTAIVIISADDLAALASAGYTEAQSFKPLED